MTSDVSRTCAAVLLAISCQASAQPSSPAQPPAAGEVRVIPSLHGETIYELQSGTCQIQWTVAHSGVDQSVARHRSECSLPLSDQIALNARIFDKLLVNEPAVRTLFFSGLSTSFPEISMRMVIAAQRSPDWDARRGRPRSAKHVDEFLRDLFAASGSTVFAEWQHLFAQRNMTFVVAGVEEATIGAAGNLSFFPQLAARGIGSGEQVPSSCLVWFSISRR